MLSAVPAGLWLHPRSASSRRFKLRRVRYAALRRCHTTCAASAVSWTDLQLNDTEEASQPAPDQAVPRQRKNGAARRLREARRDGTAPPQSNQQPESGSSQGAQQTAQHSKGASQANGTAAHGGGSAWRLEHFGEAEAKPLRVAEQAAQVADALQGAAAQSRQQPPPDSAQSNGEQRAGGTARRQAKAPPGKRGRLQRKAQKKQAAAAAAEADQLPFSKPQTGPPTWQPRWKTMLDEHRKGNAERVAAFKSAIAEQSTCGRPV